MKPDELKTLDEDASLQLAIQNALKMTELLAAQILQIMIDKGINPKTAHEYFVLKMQ